MKLRIYAFYRFSQYFMLLLNVFQYFLFFIHFHLNQNFSNPKIFVSVLVQKSLFLSLLQIIVPFLFPFIYGSILIPKSYSNYYCFILLSLISNSKIIKLSLSIITYYYDIITLLSTYYSYYVCSIVTYCILI